MANPFSVPLPVYDFSVLGEVGKAYNDARAQAQNAETQAQYAKNAAAQRERESAEELRRRDEFEMKKVDRRDKALKSANELLRMGRTSEAQALLTLHGISATPEMGAPTVVTPQPVDIVRGMQPTEQAPVAGQHSGAPAVDMRAPVDAPPEPEPNLHPAAEETMPLTIPGDSNGAMSFAMDGKQIGRFDPAEEQRFRGERAGRVETALGPLGDKITAIADLAARGDINDAQAGALYRMIQADSALAAKAGDAKASRDQFGEFHQTANQQIEQKRLDRESAERRAAKRGGSGGGSSGGMADFIAAAGKLKPGDQIPPEIAPLARSAGLKPNQVAAEVDKYRNSGKKSEKGSGVLTQKQLTEADQGIRDLDRLIAEIERNPKAWDEYRGNAESWERGKGLRDSAVGSVFKMGHVMDVRPEQGLKSGEARRVFQYQEKLNTNIAKGFGGVITEGDRTAAGSQQANFAVDPSEKLRQLKEMRADFVAKRSTFTASDAPEAGGGGGKTLAPKDQEAVDWANANPGDPRAKKILQLHGM